MSYRGTNPSNTVQVWDGSKWVAFDKLTFQTTTGEVILRVPDAGEALGDDLEVYAPSGTNTGGEVRLFAGPGGSGANAQGAILTLGSGGLVSSNPSVLRGGDNTGALNGGQVTVRGGNTIDGINNAVRFKIGFELGRIPVFDPEIVKVRDIGPELYDNAVDIGVPFKIAVERQAGLGLLYQSITLID